MLKVLSAMSLRNRLAVEVTLATGLRIGDVLNLRCSDIGKDGTIRINEMKTGKQAVKKLPPALHNELKWIMGNERVFEGKKVGKARTRQAVWKDMKRAVQIVGAEGNITPHSARKTYAVELYKREGSIGAVKKALNHKHKETTELYALSDTKKMTDEEFAEMIARKVMELLKKG